MLSTIKKSKNHKYKLEYYSIQSVYITTNKLIQNNGIYMYIHVCILVYCICICIYITFTGRNLYVSKYLIIYLYKVGYLEEIYLIWVKMKIQKIHMSTQMILNVSRISEKYT